MGNTFQRWMARMALLAVPFAALLWDPAPGWAGTITLGSAQGFAVLGGQTVTNTGSTTIRGDVGVYPGSAITDQTDISLIGTFHESDAVAQKAESAATAAYIALAGQSATSTLTGQDLGGMTLAPGVYFFSSTAQLTGVLTLDFGTTPNADFIFQIGSGLTTASNSSVVVKNAGAGSGVYWQVGSSATLNTGTAFAGNIVALTSIFLRTDATILCGRALARNGEVTMDTNTISDTCSVDNGSGGFSGAPEPGTLTLLGMGLGAGLLLPRKFRLIGQAGR